VVSLKGDPEVVVLVVVVVVLVVEVEVEKEDDGIVSVVILEVSI
jgi:hypothetical protein